MKALVEKKTQFIEVNEKFSELVTTTYFLGVPVFRNSKKLTAPYGTSLSFDEKEIKSYYANKIIVDALRYRPLLL